MRPRLGRLARWLVLALIALTVVMGWAGVAEAGPAAPEEPTVPQDAECPEGVPEQRSGNGPLCARIECDDRNALDKLGDIISDDDTPTYVLVIPRGDGNPDNDTVYDWDWYVYQARKEAEEEKNCALAAHSPSNRCRTRQSDQGGRRGRDTSDSDLSEDWSFPFPDGCWGPYDSSHYQLSYDEGGVLAFNRKLWGAVTTFVFMLGKGAIEISLFLVGHAFAFDLTEYTDFSHGIARNYQVDFIQQPLAPDHPWNLEDIAWVTLFSFAGFKALRGKLTMAGGEIVLSIVVASLAVVLVTQRDDYMETTAALIDDTSSALLLAGTSHDPTGNTPREMNGAVRLVQGSLYQEFVGGPYDWLNWGPAENLEMDKCRNARNRILQAGLTHDGGWSRNFMRRQGCIDAANYNADASSQRLLGATLTMVVGFGAALAIGLLALTVLVSKFVVALLFAVVPFAAVAAVLPGTGRRLAWGWLGTLVQSIVAVVGASFVLTFLMLAVVNVQRSLPNSDGEDMTRRWIAILLILIVVYLARQRMLRASQRLATSVADNLTRLSPASANWAGGVPTGLNLQSLEGPASKLAAAPGAGTLAALDAGRRSLVARHQRRDAAKRALKNLQKMERYKEERDGFTSHSFRKPKRVLVARKKPGGGSSSGDEGPGAGSGPPKGGNPAPSGSPKPSGAPAPSTGARGAARRFASRFGFGSRNAGAHPSPANAAPAPVPDPVPPRGILTPPTNATGPARWSERPTPQAQGRLERRWERRQELRSAARERRQEARIEDLQQRGQVRGMPGWRGWRDEERHQIELQYERDRENAWIQFKQDRKKVSRRDARATRRTNLREAKERYRSNARDHTGRWARK